MGYKNVEYRFDWFRNYFSLYNNFSMVVKYPSIKKIKLPRHSGSDIIQTVNTKISKNLSYPSNVP